MTRQPGPGKLSFLAVPRHWRLLLMPALVLIGGLVLLVVLALRQDARSARINTAADAWALAYWRTPIPPQGAPPPEILAPARGIAPEDCGQCHQPQYEAWRASLHSEAMGPGVVGQFHGMGFGEQAQCLDCHAPLSEQWARRPAAGGTWVDNPAFAPALTGQGITCAACHLRGHVRHGPPLREGRPSVSQAVHGAPVRTPHFQASEFCKGCHQHPSASLQLNGKTIENTYNEWLASPAAAQGITCQGCHMPDRQHHWRGIHDKAMTLQGVTISASVEPAAPALGGPVEARLTIANTGTGHAFPTYTTPAVFLRAAFLDGAGQVLPGGYFAEKIIQRRLNMAVSPWQETFDTRLLPGDATTLRFARQVPAEAVALYLWIWVEPDHFYTDFFQSRLRADPAGPGAAQYRASMERTLARRYLLFGRTVPLAPLGDTREN